MNHLSAEANRAWVRNRIARAGLTEEIETHAAQLVAYYSYYGNYDAPDYAPDDAEAEYLADVFAESAEDYQRDYPESWQESDANPEG